MPKTSARSTRSRRRKNIYESGPFIGRTEKEAQDFWEVYDVIKAKEGPKGADTWAFRELSKGHNLETLIQQWVCIDSVSDGKLPLVPNWAQRKIIRLTERYLYYERPLRLELLKARRLGMSTIISAISYILQTELPHFKALGLADKDEHTNTLRDMLTFAHDNVEFPLKAGMKRPGFRFEKPHFSLCDFETAGGKNPGRSKGYRLIHRSEVAFFDDAAKLDAALMATVPKTGFTAVYDESTANGSGGYFYHAFQSAMNKGTDSIALFLPWWKHPSYAMPLVKGEEHRFDREELDGEEKVLQDAFGLGPEQFKFRRFVIESEYKGDTDTFHQEYPSTWEEAFLVGGRAVFDRKTILSLTKTVPQIKPVLAGDLVEIPQELLQ